MSTPKICPLLAVGNPVHMAKCREDGCAWWDHLGGSCWIASGADCIREAANQLNALNIIIEAQEQEESPASAANAGEGEGGKQGLLDTVSTSTITENGGFVK